MTPQEIFTKGVEGILAQGVPSANGKSGDAFLCMYRDNQGNKCFLGHSISDEDYEPFMEGKTVSHPSIREALGLSEKDRDTMMDVARMQRLLHDNIARETRLFPLDFMPKFKIAVHEFALRHNLEVPDALSNA